MLKLKKIHILGFKSFCDRTELAVPGSGIACVVGPNGCGKSNILDGVTWVLGEQSAKTLRGAQMSDVIFAGTRDRKSLGMAEVTITMVDPAAYEGPMAVEPEVIVENDAPEDWDEEELRRRRAAEAEEIISAEQPGQVIEEEGEPRLPELAAAATEASAESDANAQAAQAAPQPVVLKIRRRKFHRTPQKGEIVITRRLFRTGESEYLLNGKLCRLRDIQDIFMGTGLGPESYAIIGQERIGQLLSSKPHDRRAIIEEAAGVTRFKTKKRLAELRLESAKQNLARVDDIFEEVTRQMNSLKRQAAKAERFAVVRDELRARLRVTLASRMALMDAEQARLEAAIAELTAAIDSSAAAIEGQETAQRELTEQGYKIEGDGQAAQTLANEAAVELERASARIRSNRERVSELTARIASASSELEATRIQLAGLGEERAQQQEFLATAADEARAFRSNVEARQQAARTASDEVFTAERQFETNRRNAMQLMTQAGNARSQTAQAEESLAALDREAERLNGEMLQSQRELESLEVRGMEAENLYRTATENLKQLESEIVRLRESLQGARAQETALRNRANQIRSERAGIVGRRDSLSALIKNHSYSTETVKRLLKPGAIADGLAPVGTLADFLEVSGAAEGVIDEFLREELNYVVVDSWRTAEQCVKMLKNGIDGRATFLVHPAGESAQGEAAEALALDGVTPLRESIKALNGLGHSLEAILPKLRHGYLVESVEQAQRLAAERPEAYFLTPEGECFHNATVTGGKPASEGPLALKRELREAESKLAGLEAALEQTEAEAAELAASIEDANAQLERRAEERRQAERQAADHGAQLKQFDNEKQRVERRVQEWNGQLARNRESCEIKRAAIEQKQQEALRLEAQQKTAEAALDQMQAEIDRKRQNRESLQQEAAALTAELAGLEERRRGAEAAFQRIDRQHQDLERRRQSIEQQSTAAEAEQEQRSLETEQLLVREQELTATRAQALEQAQSLTTQARELREQLATIDAQLKTGRAELDQRRDQRATLASEHAKLRSDLEHLEASCLSEVNLEAAVLRDDAEIVRITDEALEAEETECRQLRQRIEQMGPVNMMALDEYKETSERHAFLETQRKDLVESIENTQQTIKEIEQISRQKFDEAFARINENFAQVFTRLFHGGQAFLRLTDAESGAESGLDIVASPPGKKLQNVLLLSGGEKALTALALLVGIFQYQPSPFCILDEVDAALDETNVGRLADLLATMTHETQFLIVTHSKRMMQAADLIYGVTMQEPGCSRVVSVHLGGDQQRRATA